MTCVAVEHKYANSEVFREPFVRLCPYYTAATKQRLYQVLDLCEMEQIGKSNVVSVCPATFLRRYNILCNSRCRRACVWRDINYGILSSNPFSMPPPWVYYDPYRREITTRTTNTSTRSAVLRARKQILGFPSTSRTSNVTSVSR